MIIYKGIFKSNEITPLPWFIYLKQQVVFTVNASVKIQVRVDCISFLKNQSQ